MGVIASMQPVFVGEYSRWAEDRVGPARALWVPRPDFTTSAESWLLAGGPHHTAYSQAVGLEVIEDFAEMLDVELLAIDANTDARQFRKEVRWTQAYRHLAGAV
jgi:L-arabinose isomerase